MIIAGLTVLSKLDMKKIIAYSKSIRCYIFFWGQGGGSKMCTLDQACLF